METKEAVYDCEIAPLMTQIIAIARRENIDFAASFALDAGGGDGGEPLMCSTIIVGEDSRPSSSGLLQKIQAAIWQSMAAPVMAFTISPGHGDS